MSSLYEILGVAKTASAAEIRRGYRSAAKTAHPDKGGSQQAFEMLQIAYDVLRDPKRRKRYDATGEYDGSVADNTHVAAMTLIATTLAMLLQEWVARGEALRFHNLVHDFEQVLSIRRRESLDRDRMTKAALAALVSVKDRFVTVQDGETNTLFATITSQIGVLETGEAFGEQERATIDKALEIVRTHRFVVEPPPQRPKTKAKRAQALFDVRIEDIWPTT